MIRRDPGAGPFIEDPELRLATRLVSPGSRRIIPSLHSRGPDPRSQGAYR
jgi:hypothetical protein